VTERDGARTLALDDRQFQNGHNGEPHENTTTQRPPNGTTSKVTPPNSGKRDYRLDFLRGLAVLVMVIDHVAGPSPLHVLTGGNHFFVSAAEGFVFISGFLVGIVYGAKVRRHGWPLAARQALGRAFTLYAVSVWLTLTAAFLASAFGLGSAPDPQQTTIGRFLLEIMTFQRAYYLVDVMQLYTLLLAVTPPALWLLHRGHWRWLLAPSSGIWLTFQLSGGQVQVPWPIQDNPVFAFASWQLLFFGAMALGYERVAVQRVWTRFTQPLRARLPGGWLPLLTVLVGIMIWLNMTDGEILRELGLVTDSAAALDAWFDKTRLPPLRLLASAIVFAFAWCLVNRFWGILTRVSGWLVLPIGTRALAAYVAHVLIVAIVGATVVNPSAVTRHLFQLGLSIPALNVVSQILAVLAVWIIVRSSVPQRMVAWLGRPPFAIARATGDSKSGRRWIVSPSLGALAFLVVGSVAALAAPWPSGLSFPGEHSREQARATVPHIEATATAKRGIANIRPETGDESTDQADTKSTLLDRTFFSPTLGREIPYGIYLPPNYQVDTNRRYPVLYLLHGAPTNYTEWAQLGLADVFDELIANGRIQPFIVVFVEGEGSYYFNHQDGPAWGDYVARDVVQYIDATERTLPDPASRAIGGLSMGGLGALQLGLNYRDVFGIIGAHGPALWSADEHPDVLGSPDYYAQYDPRELARTAERQPLATWLDVPSQDPWLERDNELRKTFEDRGWTLVFEIYEGEHKSEYWYSHIPDYLAFYSENLSFGPVATIGGTGQNMVQSESR
jgi:enterochelin esterase-like enzyme